MTSDAELLRRYARENSEPAFAELVARYLPLIYAAALRHVGGDAHLARDVAQQVFIALARKAGGLTGRATIVGWLYLSTHHAAAQAVRSRQRRQAYEREAQTMNEILTPPISVTDWDRVRPLLDDAMRELNGRDREAVLLRYFSHRPFAEIGGILRLSEDAARMRVERALDKLRVLLKRRGISSTTGALGLVLQGNVTTAAPTGLAATITESAFATGMTGGGVLAQIFSANSYVVSSAIAAVVALGVVLYYVREQSATERTLFALGMQRTAEFAPVHDLAAAEARGIEDAQVRQANSSVVAKPSSGVVEMTPAQTGEHFLTAHPEARRWIDVAARGIFERDYGAALRGLGLTSEEYERIVADPAIYSAKKLSRGGTVFVGGSERSSRLDVQQTRIRELLGENRAAKLGELQAKLAAKSVIGSFAAASYDSDVPLSPAQATVLSAAVDRHCRVERTGRSENIYAIDWDAISNDALKVLSAPQFQAFSASVAKNQSSAQTAGSSGSVTNAIRAQTMAVRGEIATSTTGPRAMESAVGVGLRGDARAQLLQLKRLRNEAALEYFSFGRAAALNENQYAQFLDIIVEHEARQLDLLAVVMMRSRATRDTAYAALHKEEQDRHQAALNDLLGSTGIRQLEDYQATASIRNAVGALAGALAVTSAPMQPEQGRQLVALLNELGFRDRDSDPAWWSKLTARASTILGPGQTAELQSWSQIQQGSDALMQLSHLVNQRKK